MPGPTIKQSLDNPLAYESCVHCWGQVSNFKSCEATVLFRRKGKLKRFEMAD